MSPFWGPFNQQQGGCPQNKTRHRESEQLGQGKTRLRTKQLEGREDWPGPPENGRDKHPCIEAKKKMVGYVSKARQKENVVASKGSPTRTVDILLGKNKGIMWISLFSRKDKWRMLGSACNVDPILINPSLFIGELLLPELSGCNQTPFGGEHLLVNG